MRAIPRRRALARLVVLVVLTTSLAAIGAGCQDHFPPTAERGTVAVVGDGDTIVLRDGRTVRLVQIDAPEAADECYGREATLALRELLPTGVAVVLERDPKLDDTDVYERLLRYVVVDGRNVNVLLVRAGAATPYFFRGERGRHADELLAAGREARAAGRGLWGACPEARLAPDRGATTGPR